MGLTVLLFSLLSVPFQGQESTHVERFTPPDLRYRQAIEETTAILERNPRDAAALRKRGVARLHLNLLEEAEADLRRAAEIEPGSADLAADLGFVLWRQGDYPLALQQIEKSIALDPEHPSANFYLGRLLLLTGGDPTRAVQVLETALDLNPLQPEIRFDLLTAYRAVGDLVKAAAQLQILQSSYPPGTARLVYAEGLIASDLGQLELAVERFREALLADPQLFGARFDLGVALVRLERWAEAAEVFDQVAREQPGSAEVAHLHALALFNAKRLAQAEREVARGIQLDNRYAPLFTLLGIMLASQGENRRAVSLFKRASMLDPDDFDARFYQGRAHFALRELEDALSALSEAARLRPNHKDARFFLATTLESLGRGDEARDEYQRLLQDHPHDVEGNVGLGALLIKQGEAASAIPLLQRAVDARPQHFEARLALGRSLAQTGQLDAALKHLQQATQLEPDSTEAHYQLALTLRRLGRRQEAEREFARVKELNEKFRGAGMGMGPPQERRP